MLNCTDYTHFTRWIGLGLLLIAVAVVSQPVPVVAQTEAPQLTAVEEDGGIRLIWTRPGEGGRWAVLRSFDEFGLIEDTLAYTSDTTWFDPEGFEYPGTRAFYRVVPWEPDDPPNDWVGIEGYEAPITLEVFDTDRDLDPVWSLEDGGAFGEPGQHLLLGGDTWKTQMLDDPLQLDRDIIWAVDAMSDTTSRLQMIGFGDGTDEMWYVLWGQYAPNTDSLIWTYQGWFPEFEWNTFNLPIGEDWYGRFGGNPEIDRVFYVNDSSDDDDQGWLRIDNLRDATNAQPNRPEVSFEWQWIEHPDPDSVTVQFVNWSMDQDSDDLTFLWIFGDGTSSVVEHPRHTYPIEGEWPVTLRVADGYERWDMLTQTISNGIITQPRGNFTIGNVGDVILARGIINRINDLGQDAIFAGVQDLLDQFDMNFGNFECPFTVSNDGHPTKGILFKARPSDSPILQNARFNWVSQANNHSMDYMLEGMLESGEVLDNAGIAWNGMGINDIMARQPVLMNYNRMKLGIIAMCNRDGHYNNYQPYLDAARDRPGFALWNRTGIEATVGLQDSVDILMYQVHCGSEYSFFPRDGDNFEEPRFADEVEIDDPYVIFSLEPDSGEVALRHYAIDQGADVVICHHPHVIQGVEVYNGKFIAHSLGDFVFDLTYNETLPSMLVELIVGDEEIEGVTVYPIWVEDDLPVRPTGELARAITDYLTHYSRLLNTHLTRPPDNEVADVQFDTTYARDSSMGVRQVTLNDHPDDMKRTAPIFLNWEGYVTNIRVEDYPDGTQIRYGRDILLWANMEEEGADVWVTNSQYEGYSTEVFYKGTRSLQIELPDGVWSNYISDFRRKVKLQSELSHSFSGYIRTQNVSEASFQIRFHNSRDGNWVSNDEISQYGTEDWTQLYMDFDEIENDWNFLNVRCNQEPPDGSTGTAWYDQCSFVEWQPWEDVAADGSVDLPYPNGYRFAQIQIPAANAPPDNEIVIYYEREWPAMYDPPRNLPDGEMVQASR